LKDLKLKAVPIRKRWLRMLISDVSEGTTQEQLVEELTGQNLPDSVPDDFIGKIFKQNRRIQRNTDSRSSAGSANFIVEVHNRSPILSTNWSRICIPRGDLTTYVISWK
jgi:hypothetical protein